MRSISRVCVCASGESAWAFVFCAQCGDFAVIQTWPLCCLAVVAPWKVTHGRVVNVCKKWTLHFGFQVVCREFYQEANVDLMFYKIYAITKSEKNHICFI